MNKDFYTIKNVILPLSTENWFDILLKPLKERPLHDTNNRNFTFGQAVVKLFGISLDEDEYYNQLFNWIYKDNTGLHLLTDETLDRAIDNQHFQSIQKVFNRMQEQNLSINRFVAFLDGENVLLKSSIPAIHRKLRESFIKVIEHFAEIEDNGLKNNDIRRLVVDIVKWSINHLQPALEDSQLNENMPKFLWYGDANKSQSYFIYYLLTFGCDIVIVHPEGEDILDKLKLDKELFFQHQYPQFKEPESFPKEERKRTATVAYRASREIESILHHEGSNLYKPWQFRDYLPISITLKTTYDEIFLLEKELAMIRPNFEVSNGEVHIPSVFAKIFGVSKNRKEYWDRIHEIVNKEESLLITSFPFTKAIISDYRYHYRGALGADGLLDPDKILSAHYWNYKQIPIGLQRGIAAAISRVCARPALKKHSNETDEDVAIFLFSQCLLIPDDFLKMLQKFDYAQAVPSIILFKTEQNGVFTREDAAMLLLMNTIGVDIIIYNPAGHVDMETFTKKTLFDIHWLEDVVFDMEYKEPSFLKRGIFSGFLKNRKGE
ncbi:YceG family protein [Niallia sp. FSL W8-0635]|uniref:YceG family protein n=1 Tax=Niallia sp. FSL W8-0635 TaxID=2975337 RepID=UPI0009CB69EF|nr:Uncharacterised protein [Mycobacteroides abscessus subsp. abscessus]HEO8421228.1 YceG family protein [Yersinia enterocolitica]